MLEQYKRLTEEEKRYLKANPHHLPAIVNSKDLAYAETKKKFGFNLRNDKSDAFRHCYWSAILSRDIGYKNALAFTTAHESSPKNPDAEKSMDLHNNLVGLRIGLSMGDNAKLSKYCHDALLAGRLEVIKE
ncbi:TPA: hypothetical protein RQJ98_004433 [Vibrio vulnificus]|uniref:DUF6973 domain-containing protein n=1 Tax=Vibrio vulnificus TaxID=672 RepID=UPI0005F0D0CC|nr:hypothetical protein [Vibrio vulnificus]MCG6311719.1 hypothetical protein [Vibrio vulnificus]HAS6364145.1 hypothetical protein [Vibrio vulnificus]HDY7544761.1 hypothetical protein [Vibrio vulnificus]HDY7685787.1 hypothetical protein [Vibrio vulnificus]